MDKIIKFPIKEIRNWNLTEKTIRDILQDINPPPELVDSIIEKVKPIAMQFYKKSFEFSYSIPISVVPKDFELIKNSLNTQIQKIEKFVHEITAEAFVEIVKLVAENQTIKFRYKET